MRSDFSTSLKLFSVPLVKLIYHMWKSRSTKQILAFFLMFSKLLKQCKTTETTLVFNAQGWRENHLL